uniref:Uncharacterized protein n=1 Tax=Caenorhabditis japonica TaxID=281687 RepID=H2VWT2_CAEJA
MDDKSAYMSAGGYSSGYMGSNAFSSGYNLEDYASGGSGGGSSDGSSGSGGGGGGSGGHVFKVRHLAFWDHRNACMSSKQPTSPADRRVFSKKDVSKFINSFFFFENIK